MRVAIFLFFMSLGKVAQSVMPPTLSEHLLILAEHLFLLSEQLLILAEHPLTQTERHLTLSEHLLILAEPLLIQSECSFIQAEHPFLQAEHPFLHAERPFLHAELPLKLFARRDTVIANHAFSVSSHETVISCPAFPIMVISVMINSRSVPLGTKTTIAASTRYGLVLAAIGRVGCCVVAEFCRASTSFCCVVAGIGSGGVDGSVHNLAQRFHDEVALVHQRVGNVQVGLIDVQVVVDEYVDVDGTVVILPVGRLALAAQLPLYVLGGGEHLAGCERGAATHAGVEEPVGGVKAPRLGFQKD